MYYGQNFVVARAGVENKGWLRKSLKASQIVEGKVKGPEKYDWNV